MIVGFPGESDRDFQDSLTLLDSVQFDTMYSFAYSPRPGTAALEIRDEIPASVAAERLVALQEHQKGIQERRNRAWVADVAPMSHQDSL